MKWFELWDQPDGVVFVDLRNQSTLWLKCASVKTTHGHANMNTDHAYKDLQVKRIYPISETVVFLRWSDMDAIRLNAIVYHVLTGEELQKIRELLLPPAVLARIRT